MDERIIDIANLLGGEKVTPQAIANARELLQTNREIPLEMKSEEILKI